MEKANRLGECKSVWKLIDWQQLLLQCPCRMSSSASLSIDMWVMPVVFLYFLPTGMSESEQFLKGTSQIKILSPEDIEGMRVVCKVTVDWLLLLIVRFPFAALWCWNICCLQLAREVLDIAAVMVKPGATTEEIDHAVHLVCTGINKWVVKLHTFYSARLHICGSCKFTHLILPNLMFVGDCEQGKTHVVGLFIYLKHDHQFGLIDAALCNQCALSVQACTARNCYPSPLNYYNFPKSCCTSVNEVICHGIPDRRPLQDGDILNGVC